MTPQTVCRFLVYVGEALSYTTINNYVSALNSLGRFSTANFDLRADYGVILLLRGFKRIKGDVSRPKDPILPTDLRKIAKHVNLNDPAEFTIWLIILLAFRTLLRKSYFMSSDDDDQEHLLRAGDVTFEPWGCKFNITSSKTIQFKQRTFDIPVSFSKAPLCAVSLLQRYFLEFPRADSELLFTRPGSKLGTPFPYNTALDTLKRWCVLAGVDKDVGFHSLRRGAASYMHSLNIELISIQKAGDWESMCVLDYLTVDFDQKRSVESLVSSSL